MLGKVGAWQYRADSWRAERLAKVAPLVAVAPLP